MEEAEAVVAAAAGLEAASAASGVSACPLSSRGGLGADPTREAGRPLLVYGLRAGLYYRLGQALGPEALGAVSCGHPRGYLGGTVKGEVTRGDVEIGAWTQRARGPPSLLTAASRTRGEEGRCVSGVWLWGCGGRGL